MPLQRTPQGPDIELRQLSQHLRFAVQPPVAAAQWMDGRRCHGDVARTMLEVRRQADCPKIDRPWELRARRAIEEMPASTRADTPRSWTEKSSTAFGGLRIVCVHHHEAGTMRHESYIVTPKALPPSLNRPAARRRARKDPGDPRVPTLAEAGSTASPRSSSCSAWFAKMGISSPLGQAAFPDPTVDRRA